MTITIQSLTPENLNKAMQLVTESFRNEAVKGWRNEEFESDWLIEYDKFERVANGEPFCGFVAMRHGSQPVAISLLRNSGVYHERMAIWDWLYRSPSVMTGMNPQESIKRTPWMLELVKQSILTSAEHGATGFTTYIGVGNSDTERLMEFAGMTPIEVEYYATLEHLTNRLKLKKRKDTNGKADKRQNKKHPNAGNGVKRTEIREKRTA